MENVKERNQFILESGNFRFSFLNSGDLKEASHNAIMINQLISNTIDGSLNNIYLRIHNPAGIQFYPLVGIQSDSTFSVSETQAVWKGSVEQIDYTVTFTLTDSGIWFWDVVLEGSDKEADIIYAQDLGLADRGAVRSNEAYMSQYMDHTVFEDEKRGYVVCSRQNQPMQGGFPYIQQGSLNKTIGYSTDGFQFYGLSYKETNIPEILTKPALENKVYQYEFAFTALQSERVQLSGSKQQFVFYGLFKENHPNAIDSLEFEDEVLAVWEQVKTSETTGLQQVEKIDESISNVKPLETSSMTMDEVQKLFPNRHEEEWDGDQLLSFFTDTHEHIVLKEKELLVERTHGHILMTGDNDHVKEGVLTTTAYMTGIFNSQLVVGNTSFNKMLTNTRNALNVPKTSGQRLYVEVDGELNLLSMPSLFEIGFNYCRWFYKLKNDVLVITNYTVVDSPEIHLHVKSTEGSSYRFLMTNQITMNNNEYEVPFHLELKEGSASIRADQKSDSASVYPDLTYKFEVTGAGSTFKHGCQDASLLLLDVENAAEWTLSIQGLLHNEDLPFVQRDVLSEIERYREFFEGVMNGFNLTVKGQPIQKVNSLAWWYTHNMLVHFSVPHGLEQYGGAAWGTRDVCQGPTEYFMATQKYGTVKEIIKTVYSHQYEDKGDWPQWFMFDRYSPIQQDESHGDIIVWPLKVISDYLAATGDFGILEEAIPYTKRGSYQFTESGAPLLDHVKKQMDYIRSHFLHDTHLSSYGDGDWDDTLQPANAQLKQFMVSSWTVALTYQAIHKLGTLLNGVMQEESNELQALAEGIEKDFRNYMLQTDVLPGFLYLEQSESPELMLHPSDSKTGIHYRLLPMNRGIISELLSAEEAEHHYQIIKDKLFCPDGVRLMNRPANYAGGVSKHFKRAEQAANFGREIGLQYVHAHIRYVEAMAKLGKHEEVWNGLEIINPVGLKNVVRNAERRQSNTYFSSSDGKFNTRYEAQENFDQLRDGTVPVKGGWRIYSSGPGIYMNQLISNCLGIRREAGNLVIDPVLPKELDGMTFDFQYNGKPVTYIFHLNQAEARVDINGQTVKIETVSNRYRSGGMMIHKETLDQALKNESNIIEIYVK
ncbi:GH36-type glycosyl hydrolase domain-containing protein [Falsibacillus albus]|uniref:Cellobiose phosphorylase n=1 Tax=Falsibacillus albus TaxID=2478915 RepID=A0A3L7K1Y3_9BACI|nr:cellobiose phosphorylase [Falsibacillus albus]RLQ96615.1 cellobiose phosphorylase [Falsibacillus albus]